MNADLQYAMTADGVRIGYCVSGSGPVLLAMPDIGFSSMLLAERDLDDVAAWAEALSQHFTYVRYDARGFGVSQHDVDDLSASTWNLDVDAVVEAIGRRPVILMGYLGSSRLAMLYACARPDMISRVVIWPPDFPITTAAEGRGLADLAQQDWESFTETLAHIALGWDEDARARRLAAFWRDIVPQSLYLQFLRQFRWPTPEELEVGPGGAGIQFLTLVRRHRFLPARLAVVADEPRARLRMLPGNEAMPFEGNVDLVIRNILTFVAAGMVSDGAEPPKEASPRQGATPSRMLSDREAEVLRLVAAGRSNAEIADALVLSVRTVERHLMRIYDKLGVNGKSARVVAAAYATIHNVAPTQS